MGEMKMGAVNRQAVNKRIDELGLDRKEVASKTMYATWKSLNYAMSKGEIPLRKLNLLAEALDTEPWKLQFEPKQEQTQMTITDGDVASELREIKNLMKQIYDYMRCADWE